MCIIPAGTTEISIDAFDGCSKITSIKIPACVKKIESAAFDGLDLDLIDVDVNNLDFFSEDNCLINRKDTRDFKARTALIRGCNKSVIPSGMQTIEHYAFFGCKSLKSITIPDTVTYIGFSSFEGCTSDGEQVRQTEIGPEADFTGYVESLEKVSGTLGLDQKRRLEYIIPDCEALRGSLQQKIDELKEELASL